jgi:hypothetical protein
MDGEGQRRTIPGLMKSRITRPSMSTILIEKNVMVPMRDGVRLATDVYRLEGGNPRRCSSRAHPTTKSESWRAVIRSTSCVLCKPATPSWFRTCAGDMPPRASSPHTSKKFVTALTHSPGLLLTCRGLLARFRKR